MRKLWVSVSGGRTSAYMGIRLKQEYSDRFELKFIFANTGLEHPDTLRFLNDIDLEYSLGIVWVEAVVNPGRNVGTTHKIVDFDSATRNEHIFETMIDKYGIPNQAYPHCTRELKLRPMNSYVKSIGWEKEFRAIGIRADEMARVPKGASRESKLYPLVDFFPTSKQDILDWFEGKPYDLRIPEHMGNCVSCWKKSDPKICRLINETPQSFVFFDRMEKTKGLCGHNVDGAKRVFFRKGRSFRDMKKLCNDTPSDRVVFFDRCANEECGIE